jgi:hypothetical protein
VLQLLSQSAGTSFNDFSSAVAPSLAQIFGFAYGNILSFNSKSPSFMVASQPHPVCVYTSDSLAYAALRNGRISVCVDPAKEPSYNAAVDGPVGEKVLLAVYVPIPDHLDSSVYVAVLVLAHVSPPSQTAALETPPKLVGDDLVELLKLVSVMLSAPLSRSVVLQATEMRLSECENPLVHNSLVTFTS